MKHEEPTKTFMMIKKNFSLHGLYKNSLAL